MAQVALWSQGGVSVSIFDCSTHLHVSVAALALLMSRLPARFSTDLTTLWAGLSEDRKWRKDIAEAMLRSKLLNGPEVDTHLCKVLQISRSPTQPVEFAVHIVRPTSRTQNLAFGHNARPNEQMSVLQLAQPTHRLLL